MTVHRKLLVIDIDNTILHTVLLGSDKRQDIEIFRNELLNCFDDATLFKGENRAVIVPRPNLPAFTEYLQSVSGELDIGIYSTARSDYLERVLSAAFPWAIGRAKFIWDRSYCESSDGILTKNLEIVSTSFGYELENIRMLDDQDIIHPKHQRIHIEEFIAHDIESAKLDSALLKTIDDINSWINHIEGL